MLRSIYSYIYPDPATTSIVNEKKESKALQEKTKLENIEETQLEVIQRIQRKNLENEINALRKLEPVTTALMNWHLEKQKDINIAIESEVKEIIAEKEELEDKNTELENKIDVLETTIVDQQWKIGRLEFLNEQFTESVKSLQSQLASLKTIKLEESEKLKKLTEENLKLKNQIITLQNRYTQRHSLFQPPACEPESSCESEGSSIQLRQV